MLNAEAQARDVCLSKITDAGWITHGGKDPSACRKHLSRKLAAEAAACAGDDPSRAGHAITPPPSTRTTEPVAKPVVIR